MDDTTTVAPVETPAATPAATTTDPFTVDEARFASLTPEQRAALDPVLDEFRTKAKGEIERTSKSADDKYKAHVEKAQALDELVKDQRFVQWWQNMQQAATSANPQAAGAIQGTKPQDFASQQEWQTAMAEAYAGNGQPLQQIQARMFAAMATPVVQQLREGQEQLKATLEMKDLFERHTDARDLDSIGRNPSDPNDKSESLLEMCLNWADENGKSLEEGYARARSWADALRKTSQQEAMGLVQGKKDAVTSGPTTAKGGQAVVEVADSDELMQKNMEYIASGQTPPRFVIRGTASTNSGNRWQQRT